MNRLLRKYNRILLSVFGVGLMIVFLMPQLPELLQQFGGQGSQIAIMGNDGKPVTREDWRMVQQQVQILQQMDGSLSPLPIIGTIGNDLDRYYLLVHEANQAGLIGGMASAGIDPDSILALSSQTGFPPAAIRQTLINYSGIRRYLAMVASSGRLSDRRIRHESRRMLDGVDTKYVIVPAKADGLSQPDAAAMATHFETYANVEPGEGEHGFGYRLPDRATVEWLEIPTASIETAVRASIASDDVDVRKYWRRNQARFDPIEPGADVPEAVVEAYVQDHVNDMRPTISRAAGDALRTPRRGFETASNFVVLPDDWSSKRISLASLREMLAERFNMPLDGSASLPEPQTSDTLIDIAAISQLPRVNSAGTDRYGRAADGNTRRTLANMVGSSREFGGLGEVPVQLGMAGPILEDRQQNLWIFRMIEADPARPPHNLDEVRDGVTEDLQRLTRWGALQGELDSMRAAAQTDGLDAFAAANTQTVQGPRSFQRYLHPSIPRPANIAGLGTDQAVIDAIIDRSIELGETPLKDTPASERILVLPSDANMAVMVAQLEGRTPLQQDNYDRFLEQGVLSSRILANELGGQNLNDLAEVFSTDALRARNKFVRAGTKDDDTTDELVDEPATDSAE
jgi:hypothetical protein